MPLEPVIGLEIHVQLKTKSKMFCSCSNAGENEPPNTTICPVCVGHPGTLPVLNHEALKLGMKTGLALGCEIPDESKFDRKNYFYPDLPKGYQISQYDEPIAIRGHFSFDVPQDKRQVRKHAEIGITRAHLEEDAAKLIHDPKTKSTLADFNRGGTPLLEIVTEPDFKTPLEAKTFLKELQLLLRALDVSNADMEKGHMRCDANISLREVALDKKGNVKSRTEPSAKIEVKNMNSFKSVERALEYEILRQTKLWEAGTPPTVQATRGWDDDKGITEEQRTKEEAHDYRYFPEPDLPPLRLKDLADAMRGELGELPQAKRKRFEKEYGFAPEDAYLITSDEKLAHYTEKVISELRTWIADTIEAHGTHEEIWEQNKKKLLKLVSGWLVNRYAKLLAEEGLSAKESPVTAENFAEFLTLIHTSKLNTTNAQKVLELMFRKSYDPSHAIEEYGLEQTFDEGEMMKYVDAIIKKFPDQANQYRNGKTPVLQFLVGMVMKESKGKANPQMAEEMMKEKLS